ncbi:hypothetical protein QJS10_CPB13g00110 [Acorus calamus]|uniref:Phospholipase A-2-activating protein n=1 Tax=Acorus calamus TaxID=4465 RepID=A0AAV9DJY7_ACOCL|nr:hypothetical protein QJS10_CPB13g00110 [Acorus calamus]
MGTGEYQLRCEIHGHEDDVRRICVCDDAGIATSSRDRTVRFWSPDPENPRKYALSKTMVGHTSFVGPLAWIPPSEGFEDGAVVSGGMDALVLLWDLKSGSCVSTMRGHRQQVTGLALDDNGDVVSASVDCTIIRWRKGEQVEAWEGHKVAIQAAAKLPSGEFVTGSSDATLKLWRGKTCLHTFTGHTDTVRDLAVMPGLGVLSASHDSSIRLWALTGQVLMEMVGHTSIVYCVDAHASGLIASGSEDCSLKLWKDGVCIQSIDHPGCVWDVKFLINGDIITACSDGTVRIWTTSTDRIAEPLEYESYASELSLYKSNRKSVGGIKLADLPGLEALQHPGNHDGQTKVIREGDNGVAYSWNSRDKIWDKIGEVVEGPEDSKVHAVLDGVKYDYVFDVDIGDGEPIRKLPYNLSDNPYTTADKWLLKEDLPLTYREQVVEFILQNSGQRNISVDHSFRDPYTGSSAYVPGEPSIQSSVSTQPIFKHIPKRGMLFFDSAQYDGILKKIGEYNNALASDLESKHLSLTELDLSRLTAIVKILKDTSHYHCSTFADIDMDLLVKLLRTWPVAIIFPAIDILRMIILHPDGANLLHKNMKNGNDILTEILKKVTAQTLAANLLTTTRAITNLFKHSNFHSWLQLHAGEILDALSDCCSSSNKNVLLSYSTLLLNYAVLLNEKKDQEGQAQVFSASLEIADERNQDVDSKFRALVAVGSLILDGNMKSIAIDLDVASIAKAAKASKDTKVAEVGADIDLLLRN